jgi:hypothetical protein
MSIVAFEGAYNGKTVRAEIHVEQANMLMWMARTRLLTEPAPKDADYSPDEEMLRVLVYPDYISASPEGWIEIDGERLPWPVPFEDFVLLPFDLCIRWEREVYKQNPSWLPEAAETQKKAPANGSESSKPSTTPKTPKAKTASPNLPGSTT